jgi:glucosylglycerate synthase
MPPAGAVDATQLLSPECLAGLAALEPVEVLAGVHAQNRAAHVASLLDAVDTGLGKHVAGPRRAAVLVADAGSQDGTADIVRGWCGAETRGPARRLIELAPPIHPGRALLGLLAAALQVGARGIVVVDAELAGLRADWIPTLLEPVHGGGADYVTPAYSRSASEGTLTTNLLAPLTRALYGKRVQQVAGGCSALAVPLIERCLPEWIAAGTPHAAGTEVALTVAALTSGARVVEVHLGRRPVDPGAPPPDLAATLVRTVGPVYALMERYHDAWEQTRGSAVVPSLGEAPAMLPDPPRPSVERMVRAFNLGLKDLLPIWEQILAEATLEQLYPLTLLEPDEFEFAPALWARVASDFAVAHHERQLPRDHVIRALTPLYLGRVAAFLREAWASSPAGLPAIFDRIGRAFEAEKDYLAARWG